MTTDIRWTAAMCQALLKCFVQYIYIFIRGLDLKMALNDPHLLATALCSPLPHCSGIGLHGQCKTTEVTDALLSCKRLWLLP